MIRNRVPRSRRVAVYRGRAQRQLRRFRRASLLAVALTAMVLFLWGVPEGAALSQDATADTAAANPAASVQEATRTIGALWHNFYALLPKLAIAAALLFLAWIASRLARPLFARIAKQWQRADAFAAVAGIVVWTIALVGAVAVIVGDARAVAGSVGILGLALSWALQAPIESFTGWLLNSFRLYYRVGDRIAVGDVFGDVYRIDLLTTTVWELGGPDKPVQGSQPTGALVTFPNSEVLRSSIVNYTRDFPAVWDEVGVAVANESDLAYAADVARRAAAEVSGDWMATMSAEYGALLSRVGLEGEASERPEAYLTPGESWTSIVVRYLVPVRERRACASRMTLALAQAFSLPEHAGRIVAAYPTRRVALVDLPGAKPEPEGA